ncbi:MAG: ABC transporter ATP-binding protein [Ruminococcaceae bacterium]|nr:ABC transporter ATP-binding protein [Oscillospiraceae bacterium]
MDEIREELVTNETEQNDDIVIKVDNLYMKFNLDQEKVDNLKEFFIRKIKGTLKHNQFVALNDVSFELHKGDRLAILGFNGAGKSTLLKAIVGVYKPTEGEVFKKGVIAPLLELGAGFEPNYSGRENIYLYGAILGYSREYIASKIDEIIEFSELGHFIEVPVKNYSSGMRARLGFSIATAVDPDVLILDEVLSVGDAKFRKKSLAKVRSLFDKGVTVLFVSHNIDQVKEICNKAILLEHGTIIAKGDVNDVAAVYEEKMAKPKAKKAKAVVVPLTDKEKKEEKKAVADAEAAYERIKHYEDEVVVKMAQTDEAEKRYEIYLNIKSAYMSEKLSKDDFIKEVDHLLEMDFSNETSSYETPHVNKLEERLKKIDN